MKKETILLKIALAAVGLPILGFVVYSLVWLAGHPANPDYANLLYPIAGGIYASGIPFYIALYQAFKLLTYIDRNEAFSDLSVKALRKIKFCAIAIGFFYTVILPFVYLLADKDDAPGLIIIVMVIAFAALVIAGFAWLLEKLLKQAIEIKTENDLTV